MNPLRKGAERDAAIVEFVRQFKFARRDQVQAAFFAGTQARTVCQRRLKALRDAGKLKCYSETRYSQYIYYPAGGQGRNAKSAHYLAILDCYLALCNSPGGMVRFEVERRFDWLNSFLVADGVGRYALPGKGERCFFLEVELSGRPHRDKFTGYKQFYLSRKWHSDFKEWPTVLIVCQKRQAEQLAKEARAQPIPFVVVTLAELQEGRGKELLEGKCAVLGAGGGAGGDRRRVPD